MNSSESVDLGAVPEVGNGGALVKWAQVKKEMREARKSVLHAHGLNEDSLKRLEEEAFLEFAQCNTQEVVTDFGCVSFTYTPIFIHKTTGAYGETRRLHWRENQ